MSDNQSQKSSTTNKSSRHRIRICAYDGKVETSNYILHARTHHGGVFTEWAQGEPLLDKPWCDNWLEFITNKKAIAINPLPQFQRGAGKQYSQKGSVSGSVRAQSERAESIVGYVEMENIIEEEEKAVLPNSNSNFGALG